MSYAVCSFFGSVHLQNANETFVGGSPTPFAHGAPESFFRGSPMPFAHFSVSPNRFRERTRRLFLRRSYAVCSFFGFVHRLGFKFLNWETETRSGPPGRPPGGPRPLDVHCTGPLRPNGLMPHRHAHVGWYDRGTLSSVLISRGEIGKRLARRFPILLVKIARARARRFPRA